MRITASIPVATILAVAILTVIMLSPIVKGGIAFHGSLYNSEDAVEVDLIGENMDFDCSAYMDTNSLLYVNGGSSTEPECTYSYSISHNGEQLKSGAKTDSGGFSFHTLVDDNYYGEGSKAYDLSLQNIVANGALRSHYGNSQVDVEEDTDLDEAIYTQDAHLKPHHLESKGTGVSLDKTDDDNHAKKILQTISVTDNKKDGSIRTDLSGDLNAFWNCGVILDGPKTTFGSRVQGIAATSAGKIEMVGDATGIPTQVLPPGKINISYEDTVINDDEYIDFMKIVEDARASFLKEYPREDNSALWYCLKQEGYIPGTLEDDGSLESDNLTGQLFHMRMMLAIAD